MADSTVTTYFEGDTGGLKRAGRDASRELNNVSKAARKSSTDAGNGFTRALSGISRMVVTGKASAKSLEKVGKSASSSIGAVAGFASGVGAAFGIAIPAGAALAVEAIHRIAEANKSLATRISEAAAAQRNLTLGQINQAGSLEGLTQAQEVAYAAQTKLDHARLNGNHSTAYMDKLQRDAAASANAVTLAHITLAEATKTTTDAQRRFAGSLQKEATKALKEFTTGTVEYDANGVNYVKTTTHMKEAAAAYAATLRKHAGTAANLTDEQKKMEQSLASFIEETHLVPENIATVVRLQGMGFTTAQILTFLGLTDKIPPKKTTKVTVTGVPAAAGQLRTVAGYLAGLHDQTVNVTVKRHFNNAEAQGAVGARIAGRFDGRDDVPVNVSRGEVILNPAQQRMVDGGVSINSALASTGALTIRAGGAFARGGKREDRSMDQFLGGTVLDRLALAASTLDEGDDRSAAALARDKITRILRVGKLGKRRLTRTERRMLLEALGGYRRDALPPSVVTDGDGAAAAEPDPFALDRAMTAGRNQGLGLLANTVFGGTGDIGAGGQDAFTAASGGTMMVDTLVLAPSVGNHATLATGANKGNATSSRTRTYSPRSRVAW